MIITYTTESKSFKADKENYSLTGNKVTTDNIMTSIDGGCITKDNNYIGNFHVRIEGDEYKVSISNLFISDYAIVVSLIDTLIKELNK